MTVYHGVYGQCTAGCTAGGTEGTAGVRLVGHGWQRSSRPLPTPEPAVEGPFDLMRPGDALARARPRGRMPTGTLATDIPRVIDPFVGRRTVSGWCFLARAGSPWPQGPGYHQLFCQETAPPPRPQVFGISAGNAKPCRLFLTYSRCTAGVYGRCTAGVRSVRPECTEVVRPRYTARYLGLTTSVPGLGTSAHRPRYLDLTASVPRSTDLGTLRYLIYRLAGGQYLTVPYIYTRRSPRGLYLTVPYII